MEIRHPLSYDFILFRAEHRRAKPGIQQLPALCMPHQFWRRCCAAGVEVCADSICIVACISYEISGETESKLAGKIIRLGAVLRPMNDEDSTKSGDRCSEFFHAGPGAGSFGICACHQYGSSCLVHDRSNVPHFEKWVDWIANTSNSRSPHRGDRF